MELRSRSRSRTPLQTFLLEERSTQRQHQEEITTTTTQRTAVLKSSVQERPSTRNSVRKQQYITSQSQAAAAAAKNTLLTSDYSSDECEVEVSSSVHLTQNDRNQIMEDARAAANGTNQISALNLYRQSGRYWDKYPKTDFTYSPRSVDRVELAPGVVQMPNMSRKSIHQHHQDSSTNTEQSYLASARQRLFGSFQSNEDVTEYEIRRTTIVTRLLRTITTVYTAILWVFTSAYRTQNSWLVWLFERIHHWTSWIMMMDTWLLTRDPEGSGGGGKRKISAILALCVVPMLLFGGWWLLSSASSAILTLPYFTPTSTNNRPIAEEEIAAPPTITPPISINHDQPQVVATNVKYDPSLILDMRQENDNLRLLVEELRLEIDRVRSQVHETFVATDTLKSHNHKQLLELTARLNRCCQRRHFVVPPPTTTTAAPLPPDVTEAVTRLLNDPRYLDRQGELSNWLGAVFVARSELDERVDSNLKLSKEAIDATAKQVMDRVIAQLSSVEAGGTMSDERVRAIVRHALDIYDADKTGLVDYAMESAGGQVLTTRCTETYHTGTAVMSIMGVPLWYPTITPRTVITPGIRPGECWAFQNFPGFLVVRLATRLRVGAFSLEHVSRLLVPHGRIDSAPKQFEVWGLADENDREPVLIGGYAYDYDGEALQFFAAVRPDVVVEVIELRVNSNHGNPNYTCLYRFRVHGTPVDT